MNTFLECRLTDSSFILESSPVMSIILLHGVLFRGGAEERILNDGHIDKRR